MSDKHWWLLQRRSKRDSPFRRSNDPQWYTLRRYSDLQRARRGRDIDSAGALVLYNEWRIVNQETGEEVE